MANTKMLFGAAVVVGSLMLGACSGETAASPTASSGSDSDPTPVVNYGPEVPTTTAEANSQVTSSLNEFRSGVTKMETGIADDVFATVSEGYSIAAVELTNARNAHDYLVEDSSNTAQLKAYEASIDQCEQALTSMDTSFFNDAKQGIPEAEKAVKDCETELAKTSEALTGAVTKSSASSGAAIEDVASSADSSESGEPNAPIPHPSLVAPTVQEDVPNLGDCSTGDHTVVLWKGTRCDGGNGAWAGGTPGTLYGVQYVGDHINDATNSYGKGIFTNVINLYRDADYGGCISTYYGQHLSFPGQNYNNCSAPVALSNSVSSLTFKAS